MKAGDRITIRGHKGIQEVVVMGFLGTDDIAIDDETGEVDAMRFCDPSDIVDDEKECD